MTSLVLLALCSGIFLGAASMFLYHIWKRETDTIETWCQGCGEGVALDEDLCCQGCGNEAIVDSLRVEMLHISNTEFEAENERLRKIICTKEEYNEFMLR